MQGDFKADCFHGTSSDRSRWWVVGTGIINLNYGWDPERGVYSVRADWVNRDEDGTLMIRRPEK